MPDLYVDMDDLVRHAQDTGPTTGIFRLLRELGEAFHARGARFVRHAAGGFVEVEREDIAAALEYAAWRSEEVEVALSRE